MRSLQSVTDLYPAARDAGLTEAQVGDSRERFGANRLTPLPREPIWKKFLEKFDEPIIKILLAAALLSMVVGLFHAAPVLGGVALGLVVVVVLAAYALGQGPWVPSLLFGP